MATAYKQTDILVVGGDNETVNEISEILKVQDSNYALNTTAGLSAAIKFLDDESSIKPNIVIIGSEFGTTNSTELITKLRTEKKFGKVKIFKISKDDDTASSYSGLDIDLVSKPETQEAYKKMLIHKISQLRRL